MAPPTSTETDSIANLRSQYGCGPIEFAGTDNALYERHLVFDNVIDLAAAGPRERFEAIARSVRDILSQRGRDSLRAAARDNGQGPSRDVSQAFQQQDQRRHPRRWLCWRTRCWLR
jgi:starch phosphorylase